MSVGSLISDSSAFSKPSLYIWKFLAHILLKLSLKDFEHYFASMRNEHNCVTVWTFFGIALLWDWNENRLFPILWPLLSFPNLLMYRVRHFSSVQFSYSVVFDSLRPHESQHTRPPCPSPTPGVHPDSRPSSQWCRPAISSSVIPFSSCPQSLPASGTFPMSQLFTWGGQSIGVSALASVLPMNTQDWSPLGWTGWISLHSKGLSRVFSNTTVQKHQFFGAQLPL